MGYDINKWILRHGESFYIVRAIINETDPLGLLKIGWPESEYDLQVLLILDKLDEAKTVEQIHDLVYGEFFEWFDEGAGNRENYRLIAQRINNWKNK
jgi:hypothetical protein